MSKLKYFINRIKNIQFKRMNEVLNREAKLNNRSKLKIKLDYAKRVFDSKLGYVDYMKGNYANLNSEDRDKMLTGENYRKLLAYLNPIEYRIVMDDKIICNRIFRDFINRKYIDLRVTNISDFEKFLDNKKYVFAKLVDGFGGQGVKRIKVSEINDINKLCKQLIKNRQYLIEEEIIQHEELNKINKYAVNNIRIVTILKDNNVHILERILRINDGKTDTISSHDIQGRLDEDGNLISNMVDDDLNIFLKHPVTNYVFKGIKIPFMKETINMCKKAALLVPNIRFIGFDVAITKNGPEIIEVNPYPCYTNYQYYLMHDENEKMNYLEQIKDILGKESKNIKW
ncbi:MAG: hypothetical protein IJK67_05730 [Bacilli bacterium]|nr:hypothetical protein [Bacilli bacterium]